MKKLLRTLGPSVDGESWYVCIDFKRPICSWKILQRKIKQKLLLFKNSPARSRIKIEVTESFELELLRASTDHGTFFLLGGSIDSDSGGWIMGEVERNLRLCIAEKENKIERFREIYSEWWLVLPDHIDYSMDPEDRDVFRAVFMPKIQHTFDKIILIDPRDYRRVFEAHPFTRLDMPV